MTEPRKGAPSRAAIPTEVLIGLNNGTVATATLSEGLAIDLAVLMKVAVPDVGDHAIAMMQANAGQGITRRMELAGALLLERLGESGWEQLAGHPSDTVRGWAAYMIGLTPKLKLKERLRRIRVLADDPHFGVREWAWMPMREHVGANVGHAIKELVPWTAERSPWLRRYAVELTRPRGVWTRHIEQLKQTPELGRPLLEPLKADPEVYVQDSVANWLNDAGKSQPGWVPDLTQRWTRESPGPATQRIVKRAMRNLG